MTLKILYAGTPELAVHPLDALVQSPRVQVVGVLTREDAPVGRKRILTPSPVAQRAEELGLPIVKANRWSPETQQQIAPLGAEAAAVVAYGTILPQHALDMLPYGWVNLHFSKLPAWRGAAPVQRALMAGENEIFSNTFLLEAGLDTGAVFEEESTLVTEDDTAGSILTRLAQSGGELLANTFVRLEAGEHGTAQNEDESVSYAAKVTNADARIDFTQSAHKILAQVRAVTPEPGAWCEFSGNRLKIGGVRLSDQAGTLTPGQLELRGKKLYVGTADGALELVRVQPAGKKMMDALAWARGLGNNLAEGKVMLS